MAQAVPQQAVAGAPVMHSHPSVSAPTEALQSVRPALQTYVHEAPVHDGVPLVMLHATPHAPQLVVVVVEVSHPLVSGAAVLQSAKPGAQLEYEHVVPLHVGPTLREVSQTLPQPPQVVVLPRLVS